AVSPDGRVAVANDRHGEELRLVETATGRDLHDIRPFGKRTRHMIRQGSLTFSPDGKVLAVAAAVDDTRIERPRPGQPEVPLPDTIHLFDVKTGQKLRSFRPEAHPPSMIVFSPDGTMLVTPDDKSNPTAFWDVATGK